MDFKYIEQLLQRYFAAETSLEEEQILHAFFLQDDMPAHLRCWQPLFRAEHALHETHLDDRFDERILEQVGEQRVKAVRIKLHQRLRPLFTAAAFVAFAVVVGTAVQRTTTGTTPTAAPEVATAPVQDELDPTETNPLDIRSAEATEGIVPPSTLDSLSNTN